MKTIKTTTIQFPNIRLKTRDAHKLRGHFGNLFRQHSPLLHNHYETGELRYKYPLVQYKVVSQIPTLIAFEEGADLLVSLFLKIKDLNIDKNTYPIISKNIMSTSWEVGYTEQLNEYRFETLWMALNQNNYERYIQLALQERKPFLNKILTGNILSLMKGLNIRLKPDQRIMVTSNLTEKETLFKDQKMTVFSGSFITNAQLPSLAGIGKAVSRGFGTIRENTN